MEKEKLIKFIKKHRNLFPEVTDKQIEIFEDLEEHEISLDISKKTLLTPLMINISDYALVSSLMSDDELLEIKDKIGENKYNIITTCCDLSLNYIESTEGNLNHPNIELLNYYIDGLLLNEDILDTSDIICEQYEDEYIAIDLEDFIIEVDNTIDTINSECFEKILSAKTEELTVVKIIDFLIKYVKQKASISMGITQSFFLDDYNEQVLQTSINAEKQLNIHIVNDGKMNHDIDITLGEYIDLYAEIFSKINKYIDYTFDDELVNLLKQLELLYTEYKFSKSKVIENLNISTYLYKKCHKM